MSGILTLADLTQQREAILALATKRKAKNVRVFGSVVRGDAKESSDIDLLIDLQDDASLLDWSGLILDLQDLLGRPVDVVQAKSLSHLIRDRVLREAKLL